MVTPRKYKKRNNKETAEGLSRPAQKGTRIYAGRNRELEKLRLIQSLVRCVVLLLLAVCPLHFLCAQAQAVLVKSISISNAGSGPRMRMDDLEKEYSLPSSAAHDCIIFANFSGNPIAQDIVLKDRYTNAESQQVLLANFRDDLAGLEVYGLDRVNRSTQDALFVFSSSGQSLWKETPDDSGYGTAIKLVRNWDGTNKPMCLAIKRGGGIMPELRDGRGTIVARMPMDGNACVGDFGGDSKQEIVMYSTSTANVYAVSQLDYSQPAPRPGNPLRQPKEYYNYSRYGSGDVNAMNVGQAPVATPAPTITPTGSAGDVNNDGRVDIVDALLVAQYYVGLNPQNFDTTRADVNRSGAIDIVDALLIAQFYVGLISSF